MFQVPVPTAPGAWTAAKYLSTSTCRSPRLACIHVVAAWQAWKYSSSVDRAGTLIVVVTPAGETPTTPGGAVAPACTVPDGVTDVGPPFLPPAEQPVVARALRTFADAAGEIPDRLWPAADDSPGVGDPAPAAGADAAARS